MVGGSVAALRAWAAPAPGAQQTVELTLKDYLQQVMAHNETVQAQMLEAESAHAKAHGEIGIFEPNLSLSAERERNKRLNNSLQQSEQNGLPLFTEVNNIYDTALEQLIPTGGKVRFGYTLSDLSNNVTNQNIFLGLNNNIERQFQTFVGVTFTQPLLKNAGTDITLADMRVAALESDYAFQQYRRQLMLVLSQAEAAYWNLYFAQEQLRFFDESVALANSVLSDSQERFKTGNAAELDVLQAQSGLAIRKTKQNEALQNYYDAAGRIRALAGTAPNGHDTVFRAADSPAASATPISYLESFQQAFALNPEYLAQVIKVREDRVKAGVARHQQLPEMNFTAAYGFNGLGLSPESSWNTAQTGNYPSWSVGVELHVPLGGNIKGRADFSAAKLALQEAVVNLNSLQNEIANAIDTAITKARGWQDSIQSYQTVVHFNEDLLKTEMARMQVGTVEPRKVLEVEADLFDARQSLAEALVQYQRTMLELQLAEGSVLKRRNTDLTRDQLHQETVALLRNDTFEPDAYAPAPYNMPTPPPANAYTPLLNTPASVQPSGH